MTRMILPTENLMNRRQASGHARAVNSTDRFHLLDGYSARHARPDSPCPKAERNGEYDGRKKGSAECGTLRRPSPASKDHPPEEPVSPVASSRLSPDIISFALGRVDSPFRVLRLPDILAACKELRRELSKSLENLDTSLAEVIAERASGKRPHEPKVAFLPLASIGHPQADGRLPGHGIGTAQKHPDRPAPPSLGGPRAASLEKESRSDSSGPGASSLSPPDLSRPTCSPKPGRASRTEPPIGQRSRPSSLTSTQPTASHFATRWLGRSGSLAGTTAFLNPARSSSPRYPPILERLQRTRFLVCNSMGSSDPIVTLSSSSPNLSGAPSCSAPGAMTATDFAVQCPQKLSQAPKNCLRFKKPIPPP